MSRVSRACQMFPSFAWTFKFPKFSVLEQKLYKLEVFKKKLIFTDWINLQAYECVIIQFVSVLIIPHLYKRSSVFLRLHSVLWEIILLCSKCARKFWQGMYACSYNLNLTGHILRLSSCCIVSQENNNFGFHQFFKASFLVILSQFFICYYCLTALVVLQVSKHTSEDWV